MLPDTEQFPQSRGSLLRFAALEGLGAAQDGIAYFDNMGIVDGSGCSDPCLHLKVEASWLKGTGNLLYIRRTILRLQNCTHAHDDIIYQQVLIEVQCHSWCHHSRE